MRDLRKDLRQYIDLRQALGYKLRKHEPRLTEFIEFLEAKGSDRITTKLAIAWATESSKGRKHSSFERLSFIRSFATHVSSMDARTEIPAKERASTRLRDDNPLLRPAYLRDDHRA
jgi:integrase/recombinase XerD